MLAVNITVSFTGDDERAGDVRACAAGRWANIADSTLEAFGDELLAVANGYVAGVFTVRGWSRDGDRKVAFDLGPAPDWDWLTGQASPVQWSRGQANAVRKVGGVIVSALRARRPHRVDSGHGWSLDVSPDGRTATVRGPSSAVVVTAVHAGVAWLAVADNLGSASAAPATARTDSATPH
ncbi:hypothetical protein [Amycolatopsis sp. SID8362]|uniref:hypothetical protein n=1 Tax=Amycolatopsis sp. SID8362 TaxID=2690346 RepID=UPI00136BFA85|nr:hypothetical protein [Amycolatopsis sp. SID8362]NBH02566.1 hypothetical protein [Amycolatopsis sp. SID8362]NED39268.1 hypothetical protein [Amycolatopsis sp. SID8362]